MITCLTIAGSDCSGGAGIQADLKTFSALGAYGMSVITSVVAENTCHVLSSQELSCDSIRDQLTAVFEDIPVDAVKLGMLPSVSSIKTVAQKLTQYQPAHVVADPVMLAKDGSALMDPSIAELYIHELLPQVELLTPNIPETETLVGFSINNLSDIRTAAGKLLALGLRAVLIKGGHLPGDPVDRLYDGSHEYEYRNERINTPHTHGTGCTLSSAIAAYLAHGLSLQEAVRAAKAYTTEAIRHGLSIGHGHGPTHHFYEYYAMKGYES